MADFDLGLAITADAGEVAPVVDQATNAVDGLADEMEKAQAKALKLETATARAATAAAALALAEEKAAAATGKSAAQQAKAAADVATAKARVGVANENLRKTEKALQNQSEDTTKTMLKQGFAVRNIGQQVADFGTQAMAPGIGIMRAFSQQAGQLGYAMSELQSGPMKKVGDFLVGPWGIAFTLATIAVATLVDTMGRASDEADKQAKKNGFVKLTVDELIKSIDDLTKAQDKAAKSARDGKVDAMAYAASLYIQADGYRAATKAALENALAEQRARKITASGGNGTRGEVAALGLEGGDARVDYLQNQLTKTAEATENARTAYRRAKADLIEYDTTTVAAAKAQDAYATSTRKLREEFAKNKITRAELVAGIAEEKKKLDEVKDADKNAAAAKRETAKATREHNKELREQEAAAKKAARAEEQLAKVLDRLQDRFDGASKKANDLADAMMDIAILVRSGDLDFGKGLELSVNAALEKQRVEQTAGAGIVATDAMKGGGSEVRRMAEEIERLRQAEKDLADTRRQDAIQGIEALGSAIDKVFGGTFGSTAGALLNRVTAKRSDITGRTAEEQRYFDGFTKLAETTGIKIDSRTIDKLGKGVAGAQTGALVNEVTKPLANALGLKTSKTGAQIGGAIGGATGIPGGDIIGSVIGSVVGGLFKKTKYGGVTLTSATDDFSTFGNSGSAQAAAGDFAGAIQSGLQSIAEQLGGNLGGFNITVGTRHGDYRVNTGGTSLKKNKGAVDFNDDAEAAASYAIQQAIAQGAITGLSAAVQKAIKSSSDVDKALTEALKVQQVEELVKGMGDDISKTFSTLDKQLAERVRIAKEYGFDLVKIEEENQKDRAKAVQDAIDAQVGSLKTLLNDLTYGDLYEGDAEERRSRILAQIEQQRTLAESGDANAASELANLYQQLVSTSKEAFGTAGVQYAADRLTAQSGAASVIEQQRQRIEAAAEQSRAAMEAQVKQNDLTSETNDILAQQTAILTAIQQALANGGGIGSLAGALSQAVTGRAVSV